MEPQKFIILVKYSNLYKIPYNPLNKLFTNKQH